MRWNNKPDPRFNDKRIIKRFLWCPLRLEDETRWLEFASIHQEYLASWGGSSRWENMKWA